MLAGAVCRHVGSEGAPVCVVVHDAPQDELSGWQLLCGGRGHGIADVRLTDLDRFIDQDKGLQELRVTLQQGQQATRKAPGQPWLVEPLPAEDEAA